MENSYVEVQNGKTLVHIEGDAVIDNTVSIHQLFIDAAENQNPVVLDLEKITSCDITFIQLICSLCYSLIRGGRSLEFFQSNIPQYFTDILKISGFQFRCNCTRFENTGCVFTKDITFSEKKESDK